MLFVVFIGHFTDGGILKVLDATLTTPNMLGNTSHPYQMENAIKFDGIFFSIQHLG